MESVSEHSSGASSYRPPPAAQPKPSHPSYPDPAAPSPAIVENPQLMPLIPNAEGTPHTQGEEVPPDPIRGGAHIPFNMEAQRASTLLLGG